MENFRKIYYKIVTLFCVIATFSIAVDSESLGIGKACFCIFVGMLYFGSFSIGKENIDPDKTVRNVLLLLLWSLLGFGIMAMGITALLDTNKDGWLLLAFLILASIGLTVAYVISIIRNKDVYAIISVVLVVAGFVIGGNSNGILILQILTLATFAAAIACFIFSFIKELEND
jgi:hypothetical protein